ncbi:prenyltransferase [Spongisporangium articulatum]|uniref:Prenyltransferase n=1 Tax=Spongisporangium articulatum TaxID=3362603 RepID=A0ABW8AVV6_9ACTN
MSAVLTAAEVAQTATSIAAAQQRSGAVPWFQGGHTDPWDHVQSAMGLTAAGRLAEARRAYGWCLDAQRADGSWATKYVGDTSETVEDPATDANFCAYLATGVWHHWSVTGDRAFVTRMWPAVRRAVEVVLELQAPGGEFRWSRDAFGVVQPEALVTGNASIHHSLRCAVALAELQGRLEPEWELAAARVRHALRSHPERFADKSRYSMDWYYPVLGGVVRGGAAARRLAARWDDFVVPGLGIRCVDDAPWVTGAETCELVLALDAAGRPDHARTQLAAMQHLRAEDGSYWTGLACNPGEPWAQAQNWPVERTTWTGATVILAVDALTRTTRGSGLFRGAGLAPVPHEEVCTCPATR